MAETNLIKKADLARVREQEFSYLFEGDLRGLMEALGVTRKIPKQAGAALKAYKATGKLMPGTVAEGDTIPLSKYETVAVNFGEITLRKWRKATSAEAIIERGYDQAVDMTNDKMRKDVQNVIKSDFFAALATGTGAAAGATFQAALAQSWGQLQVKFEDNDIQPVHFMNPLDVADYLATATITMQNAFGMRYVEDFLGLGTVFFSTGVPKGSIYSTARDNLVLYYVPVNGADLDEAFDFTYDETGYIGIHEEPDYSNMTSSTTVINGMVLLAERLDGVIVGTIGSGSLSLNKSSVTIAPGGSTTVTLTGATGTVSATSTDTNVSASESSGTVTVSADAGTVSGVSYVTLTDGANNRSITLEVIVVPSTAAVSLSTNALSIAKGATGTATVSGATGSITCSSTNSKVTASEASGTVTVSVASSASAGTYYVVVADSEGRTATIAVTVPS